MDHSVAVVGLGKLGLTWALLLASKGFKVTGIDVNLRTIERLKKGELPISEPGCEGLMKEFGAEIDFGTDLDAVNEHIDSLFVIVPTPSLGNSRFDSSYVEKALHNADRFLCNQGDRFCNVIVTSTVMPGECTRILSTMSSSFKEKIRSGQIGYCYNPEFIALGSVVQDMLNPDFILVGSNESISRDKLIEVYKEVNGADVKIRAMSLESAEITKIAINTFLTLKISYANQIGIICDLIPNADKNAVTNAIGSDSRIGTKYLSPGLGFGGPCLPRDTRAFSELCVSLGIPPALSDASADINSLLGEYARNRSLDAIEATQTSDSILVCGVTYKPGSWLLEDSHAFSVAFSIARARRAPVMLFDEMANDIRKYSSIWESHSDCFSGLTDEICIALSSNPNVIVLAHKLLAHTYNSLHEYIDSRNQTGANIQLIDLVGKSDLQSKAKQKTGYCSTKKEIHKLPPRLYYSLREWFDGVIGLSAEKAHTLLHGEDVNKLLNKNNDQSTYVHKLVYNAFDEDDNFQKIYERIISHVCKCYRLHGERLLVQAYPSLRVQFPGNLSVFEFHKDRFYSHPDTEINTFLAITDCIESASLWSQQKLFGPFSAFSTYKPLNLVAGTFARLDTATTWHGDIPNLSSDTRISVDFRILRSENELNHKETLSRKRKISVGSYYRYFDTEAGLFK